MPTRYLVLRTTAPLSRAFSLSTTRGWEAASAGPTDLTVETVDGHETDAGRLRADSRNVVVMDAEVVLALIAPKAQAPADVSSLKQVGALKMPDGLVAVGAHTTPFTGQGVTVAILDTGIDETHPAFQGKVIVKKDFTGEGANDQDVRDNVGHGTHCAATICGAPVGDIRVGVACGVTKLCVGKVLGNAGGTLEMLLKGLCWAVLEEKASVVSMSLGYDLAGNTKRMIAKGVDSALAAQAAMRQQSDIIKGISTLRAFLESQLPNVVFVAASGNESDRPNFVLDASLPAAELFAVGAVGPRSEKWEIAPFSNGRAQVVAPGVDVLSAAPGGGWAVMSGTSMATPHAAGVAALWTEKLRNAGAINVPETVRSAIKSHAVTQPLLTTDINAIGVGLVQAPQS
jgi:subtilisin family serine protease